MKENELYFWSVTIEVRNQSVYSTTTDQDTRYVVGYNKSDVEQTINPHLIYQQQRTQNMELVIRDIKKVKPVHLVSQVYDYKLLEKQSEPFLNWKHKKEKKVKKMKRSKPVWGNSVL